MRIYPTIEETINEWSRILRIQRYSSIDETLQNWSKRLAKKYGRSFVLREKPNETLKEWAKII